MANNFNNNNNNRNQESPLRVFAIIMGQIIGGNQLNAFFTYFPPAGRLTLLEEFEGCTSKRPEKTQHHQGGVNLSPWCLAGCLCCHLKLQQRL